MSSAASAFPDLDAKRRRFLRFETTGRLGNLASTLARASDLAVSAEGAAITHRMLTEANLLIAWMGEAAADLPSGMDRMKRDLERLESMWEASSGWAPSLGAEVQSRCREHSQQALEWSGLLEADES